MKKRLLALFLAVMTAICMASCGKNNNDGDGQPEGGANELAIYCVNVGTGIGWIQSLMEGFKAEPWVKEKYPNLSLYLKYNDQESYSVDIMKAGRGGNPYDIVFGSYLTQFSSNDMVYDLTDSVYNAIIPGEGVTVKSKLTETVLMNKGVPNANGGTSYYTLPWSASLEGMAYNAEKLASFGIAMPVTTNEFLSACAAVTAEEGYACLSSREGNAYWSYMFHPLVVQYMSPEGYSNFFNGVDEFGMRSNRIFDNKATLRVMEFYQSLLQFSKGYVYKGSDDVDFMAAQLQFYKGTGVFMPNGSWLETEMSNLVKKAKDRGDKIYDIRFMKYPIISAIIEVLPDHTIADDATLAAVVRAIDAGETSYTGVSDADFRYIAKARSVVKTNPDLDCCIPAYADSKDIATDFLIYSASKRGIQAYYAGCNNPSPFYYDVKAESPEIYNNLSSFGKSRIDMYYGNALYPRETEVPSSKTKLNTQGGIDLTRTDYRTFYGNFSQVNENNVTSAQAIWQATKDYWTNEKFNEALQKAGL